MAVTTANPTRKSGYEDQSHMHNMSYVRRFAERNLLSLRTSSEISKGRQIKRRNFSLTERHELFLFGNDEAMRDPRMVLIKTRLPLTWD